MEVNNFVVIDNRNKPLEIVSWGSGFSLPSMDPECLTVMVKCLQFLMSTGLLQND